MIKKAAIIFLSVTLLSLAVFATKDTVVATYSGHKVTESEIMETYKADLERATQTKGKKFADLDNSIKEQLVRSYIQDKLLDKEVAKMGIEKTKDFKEKLANVQQRLLRQILIENHLKQTITDAKIKEAYDKLVKERSGQDEVNTSHILVDTEDKANEVKKKINKKGTNFAELAKKYSKDPGSKSNGGNLGFFLKGGLVKDYADKAFSMKEGEISDPVKTEFGYHIIKKIKQRKAITPPLADIENSIRIQLSQQEYESYIKKLQDSASINLKF